MSSTLFAPPRQPLRLPPLEGRYAGLKRSWFNYGTSVTFTGAGQTLTATIAIDGGGYFELHSITFADSEAPNTVVPATVRWSDSTNNLGLMSSFKVPINSVAGTGAQPHYLVVPYVFDPKALVSFEFTNNGGAAHTVFVTLEGAKLVA